TQTAAFPGTGWASTLRRWALAVSLSASGTASSKSTMMASAPLLRALAIRSGRMAGTNRAERTTVGMSDNSFVSQRLNLIEAVVELIQNGFAVFTKAGDGVHAWRIGGTDARWVEGGQ